LDLRALNKATRDITFKMEDARVVRDIARRGDYATSIDLKSAFNHVPVNPKAIPYLTFRRKGRCFTWKGMPFGAKHSPLIFTKIMKVVLKFIRRHWRIRCVGYMDDLLFIHPNPTHLEKSTLQIAKYLQWLGWTLSMEKCELRPKQVITFLGWQWDFQKMEIEMKRNLRKQTMQLITKWIGKCERGSVVPVRKLASLLGKLNFLRVQFERMSLYTVALNRRKVMGVKKEGWDGSCRVSHGEKGELRTIRRWVKQNNPKGIRIRAPQATLTTDASMTGWGAELMMEGRKLLFWGDFDYGTNHLTSSN
jgi:hypothetical protein